MRGDRERSSKEKRRCRTRLHCNTRQAYRKTSAITGTLQLDPLLQFRQRTYVCSMNNAHREESKQAQERAPTSPPSSARRFDWHSPNFRCAQSWIAQAQKP